ncbi:uncharacterized protein UV8b_06270 [Ustilaginoidea virens]|uniref:feruloyl esterase n=1 Tax=Ustilaginoidea virens TaxID=1159556 RepID=A0A8E5HUY4_USTVR|nr:uncharacterized protein UV8b_06270 [Ustilaginoidea virens]QUC22029.1 hypothetical protein UV8b_06270 [Ustilaginoidea virens]
MPAFCNLTALLLSLAITKAQGGSAGCGKTHDFVGHTREFSIQSSGGLRTYRIHLPLSYDSKTAKPLLIAYHGHGNNPDKFELQTNFSNETVNPDMIVVYPAGLDKAWQGPSYARKGVSDKVFTTDLVNHIKSDYCVKESRVYATGHSNGGGFVGTLACSPDHGGQFAAFAPISGAFYTDVKGNQDCHPARSPLPMFEVHGTGDKTIPYAPTKDGSGGPLPSVADWVRRWSLRNKCDAPQEKDLGNGVHDVRYKCQGVADGLEHIKVDGMGHPWPGPDSQLPDVSLRVVGFLNKHTKP